MREFILRHFEDNDHTTIHLSFPLASVIPFFLCSTQRSHHKTQNKTTHTSSPPNRGGTEEDKTMDVTFVLEESGVTATVEVPCEADVAAAKEVACTALAVSPASVEMRIGTQVLEGTCRLQDTAFDAGVQVVLARPRFADIKCPAEYSVEGTTPRERCVTQIALSPCGALCLISQEGYVAGFDTETFTTVFRFKVDFMVQHGRPTISRCKTRCYLANEDSAYEVALPGGEVLRKVDGPPVFACGGVVVSCRDDGVSVYDEDLTLLRTLPHKRCRVAMSHCGGWAISSSGIDDNVRLWDVNTGEAVACGCVRADGSVALSRSASVFAVVRHFKMYLYDWSGAALGSYEENPMIDMQFTPCGKYIVLETQDNACRHTLHQYNVSTMSCVRVFSNVSGFAFALSPCSRVVVVLPRHSQYYTGDTRDTIETRHLYPY